MDIQIIKWGFYAVVTAYFIWLLAISSLKHRHSEIETTGLVILLINKDIKFQRCNTPKRTGSDKENVDDFNVWVGGARFNCKCSTSRCCSKTKPQP